jgi:hypothetical protein
MKLTEAQADAAREYTLAANAAADALERETGPELSAECARLCDAADTAMERLAALCPEHFPG